MPGKSDIGSQGRIGVGRVAGDRPLFDATNAR